MKILKLPELTHFILSIWGHLQSETLCPVHVKAGVCGLFCFVKFLRIMLLSEQVTDSIAISKCNWKGRHKGMTVTCPEHMHNWAKGTVGQFSSAVIIECLLCIGGWRKYYSVQQKVFICPVISFNWVLGIWPFSGTLVSRFYYKYDVEWYCPKDTYFVARGSWSWTLALPLHICRNLYLLWNLNSSFLFLFVFSHQITKDLWSSLSSHNTS